MGQGFLLAQVCVHHICQLLLVLGFIYTIIYDCETWSGMQGTGAFPKTSLSLACAILFLCFASCCILHHCVHVPLTPSVAWHALRAFQFLAYLAMLLLSAGFACLKERPKSCGNP
ncbi:unnamed protein product [Symbiodinium natans]|uniref:Uncharacterized protein n=1 Tax=Symbiodinium natans TaxID=878477 RepID=A0A812NYD0_9DINO|nr:unnamed protein product [Symbiodinium natans]